MTKACHLDWEALVEEQRTSRWNIKKFCLEKGIPYQAFKNHKYATLDSNPISLTCENLKSNRKRRKQKSTSNFLYRCAKKPLKWRPRPESN